MNICVFCSSSNRIDDSFLQVGYLLGQFIAESGNTLLYGGAKGGLMSAIAKGANSKDGEIIGVIAQAIVNMRRQSELPKQQILVPTLSERKERMKELADLFVVLPGGYGTLDEMFDVMVGGIVGEHNKQIILLNENNFFGPFLTQVELMRKEKFIPEKEQYSFSLVSNLEECKKKIVEIQNS